MLPEGTHSNNQYLDQIIVNIPPTITFPIQLTKISINVNGNKTYHQISNLTRILLQQDAIITIPTGYVLIWTGPIDVNSPVSGFWIESDSTEKPLYRGDSYCLINKNSNGNDIISLTDETNREWVSAWDGLEANSSDCMIAYKYMYDINDWFLNLN